MARTMLPPFTSASHDGDLGCFVRNIILNSIFQKGQFIIPDIASQTGFSVTTIASMSPNSMRRIFWKRETV